MSTPRAITMQRNSHSPIFLEQRHCRPLCEPTGREWRPSEEVAFAPRGRCGYLSPCTEDAFVRYQFNAYQGALLHHDIVAWKHVNAAGPRWPIGRSGPGFRGRIGQARPPDSLPLASMLRGSRGHAIVTVQADGIVWCSWIPWCH
jgi:hypothetical protein